MTSTTDLESAAAAAGFEQFRPELTAYCYRMLGSPFEADDAVQETLVRAWRGFDNFEGRAALRSWLYRIASNVCFDMLRGRKRRALPIDLFEVGSASGHVDPPTDEIPWIGPLPDARIGAGGDPAEEAELRDSVRLAFVTALQHLPARQRAVLILREVLKWKASEVAELLDTTVVSVNSALQRARATLADHGVTAGSAPAPVDPAQQELLARYVDAFERFDIEALVAILHEDATMQMPPWPLWLRGNDEWRRWLLGPGAECRGSRIAAVEANGAPAFAQWRADPAGGWSAWAIHVLSISGGVIAGIDFFVDPGYFALFDLPVHLEA
jgi:RNA polymerase sigma-70 factor, ECF subfamily